MDQKNNRDDRSRIKNDIMDYCQNCGHERHDGPLWKEFKDGDNKPVMIEVCKQYRVIKDPQ